MNIKKRTPHHELTMRHSALLMAIVIAMPIASSLAQEPAHTHNATPLLGSVNFHNSGNAAAQAPFQRGVAWLHNFKYEEAASNFREAQQADKSLALSYWLEALTYSHVVWSEENLPHSQKALARLAPTPALRLAKAKTSRERAFGAAVEAFYANGTLTERTRAYADSLQLLASSDTTDLEAAAFASHGAMVAWMAASAADKPKLATASRAFALRVFNANPNHPGAAHYLTHVADMDPRAAGELLPFARAYDKIAPDADHALHMPSHVYLPLGLWQEVSSANERAWAASRAEVKSSRASLADLSWHSLEWLQYAYLQEGRWDAARMMIDSAQTLVAGVKIDDADADARFAANVLSFTYSMETGDWTAWRNRPLDVSALFAMPTPTARAWTMTMTNAYQLAIASLNSSGDTTSARAISQRFRKLADTLPPDVRRKSLQRNADQIDALIARDQGNLKGAIALLRSSIEGEPIVASTPPTFLPGYELMGEILLQVNQADEAADAYEHALVARPNRSRALLGLAQSFSKSGRRANAEDAYKRLAINWKRADAPVLRKISADRGR